MVTLPVGAGPLDAVTSPLMVSGCPGFGFGGSIVTAMLTMLVGGGVVEAKGDEVARAGAVEEMVGVDDGCAGVVEGVLVGTGAFVVVVPGVGKGVVDGGVVALVSGVDVGDGAGVDVGVDVGGSEVVVPGVVEGTIVVVAGALVVGKGVEVCGGTVELGLQMSIKSQPV